jgi:hypothetical protein
MNISFWGPSHGLIWKPETFILHPPDWPYPAPAAGGALSTQWIIEVVCKFHWIADIGFPLGPLTGFPAEAFFPSMDFENADFDQFSFLPVNQSDPDYASWVSSPESGSWHPVLGAQYEFIAVDSDPASSTYTGGRIWLFLWSDIDLAPLFPMAFELTLPEMRSIHPLGAGGKFIPVPGVGATISTV